VAYSFGLVRGKRLIETWGVLLYDLHKWDYALIVSQLPGDFNRFDKRNEGNGPKRRNKEQKDRGVPHVEALGLFF
jgi:hypothetical protein